jgi:DNA-binding MarR family transcriptional regulator
MADDGAPPLTRDDFEHLLAFRTSLRRFQRWSEDQAKAAGLTHVQHQLLVAVKGHPGGLPPTVSELADYLLLRHHSTVELVDRAEAAGLVRRIADIRDARLVRVRLTSRGDRILTELTPAHLVELHSLAAVLDELVSGGTGRNGRRRSQPGVIASQAGAAARRPPRPG